MCFIQKFSFFLPTGSFSTLYIWELRVICFRCTLLYSQLNASILSRSSALVFLDTFMPYTSAISTSLCRICSLITQTHGNQPPIILSGDEYQEKKMIIKSTRWIVQILGVSSRRNNFEQWILLIFNVWWRYCFIGHGRDKIILSFHSRWCILIKNVPPFFENLTFSWARKILHFFW